MKIQYMWLVMLYKCICVRIFFSCVTNGHPFTMWIKWPNGHSHSGIQKKIGFSDWVWISDFRVWIRKIRNPNPNPKNPKSKHEPKSKNPKSKPENPKPKPNPETRFFRVRAIAHDKSFYRILSYFRRAR